MSTRSAIAKPHGDGWIGRYHHSDGCPSGLGATLWGAYHGHFGSDVDAMQKYFIEDEPIGWSCVVDADFSLPAGWETGGPRSYRDRDGENPMEPMVCTCSGKVKKNADCDPLFIEWAYVLTPDAMVIYKHIAKGKGYLHTLAAVVRWDEPEPKWDALEGD